ncbi:MAG: ASCH domain-containing protein [Pseudomonadota bacterium]
MAASLEEVRARYPGTETFRFADGDRDLGERLLQLVRSGAKRATCQAKSVYDAGEEPWPKVGRRDIALNWDGTPALVIETTSLEEWSFMDVPEDFALAEGEDETLEGWRAGHKWWFEKTCGFSPDMILVCERFRVVEDFA